MPEGVACVITYSNIFHSFWYLQELLRFLVLSLGCSSTSSGSGIVSSSISSLRLSRIWPCTEPGNYRAAVSRSDGKEARHFLASLGHWFLDHPGTLQYEIYQLLRSDRLPLPKHIARDVVKTKMLAPPSGVFSKRCYGLQVCLWTCITSYAFRQDIWWCVFLLTLMPQRLANH